MKLCFEIERPVPQSLAPAQDAAQVRVRSYLAGRPGPLVLARLSGRDMLTPELAAASTRPHLWSAVAVAAIQHTILPMIGAGTFPGDRCAPLVVEVAAAHVRVVLANQRLPACLPGATVYVCEASPSAGASPTATA